jgi:hypothetical protein
MSRLPWLITVLALLLALGSQAVADKPVTAPGTAVAKQTAMRKAARALHAGQRAKQLAHAALRRATKSNKRLNGLAVQSATAGGTVTTGDEDDYVALGGPEVTVTVPESGLIEVWSTVTFDDPSDGLVALYEDGRRVPNGDSLGICGSGTLGDVLLSAFLGADSPVTVSTPGALLSFGGCGTPGEAPAPVMFERPPGTHTYELRYADCGCDEADASFSDRTLRVAARL